MPPEEIALNLTAEEINLVLEGLGNLPFVRVYGTIGKIQNQAAVQLNGGKAPHAPDSAAVEADHE